MEMVDAKMQFDIDKSPIHIIRYYEVQHISII